MQTESRHTEGYLQRATHTGKRHEAQMLFSFHEGNTLGRTPEGIRQIRTLGRRVDVRPIFIKRDQRIDLWDDCITE